VCYQNLSQTQKPSEEEINLNQVVALAKDRWPQKKCISRLRRTQGRAIIRSSDMCVRLFWIMDHEGTLEVMEGKIEIYILEPA
jgi:hypothetical protein